MKRNLLGSEPTGRVVGVVSSAERGNYFVSPNEPENGQWFAIKTDEIVGAVGVQH